MKKNGLTYEELIDLAKKHYNDGGDGVVECWDRNTFDSYWLYIYIYSIFIPDPVLC